ncbi:hypothetical protein ACLOJK_010472 [Asimina triloba]
MFQLFVVAAWNRCAAIPSTYVSWDGIHLTEAAYRFMAHRLMEEGLHFTHPITNPSSWSSTAQESPKYPNNKVNCQNTNTPSTPSIRLCTIVVQMTVAGEERRLVRFGGDVGQTGQGY